MKNFLSSLLGSLAALWITIAIIGFMGLVTLGVIIAGTVSSGKGEIKEHSVLSLDLSGTVTERPGPVDIMSSLTSGSVERQIPLNEIVASLRHAADDDNISGLFIKAGGASMGLAQAKAISDAVADFKASGKWVIAYGDTYTQGDYVVACGADSVLVNPIGMVDIHGLESTTLYFKSFLEKIGVEVQVVKVGTYKSAVEPFLLSGMSEANREQQTDFLGAIWGDLKSTIARGRNLPSDSVVNVWADSFAMTQPAQWYVDNRIADALRYRHQVDETLRALTDRDLDDKIRFVDTSEYYSIRDLASASGKSDKKMIAVLYAVGDITEDGEGGIASERLVPQIFELIDNDKVDGLILRVNSGGGSAYASEQIWEALEQFKARTGKPFYVSMGDMAASGGYYISCGADKIFAEPVTLTGSIGIFGMIPQAQKLLSDKIGINSATVATNTPSLSIFRPMTEAQRASMQAYVDRGYDLFTRRCAEGRHMSQDSIRAIAEGRVWAGVTALELGLVDSLGSLSDAVTAMAAHLDASDSYYVAEYPKVKLSFFEEVMSQASNIRARAVDAELGEAAPYYRAIRSLTDLDPVQARADYIEIH